MEEYSSDSHYGIAASVDDVCVQCKVRHRPGSEEVDIWTSIGSEEEQMLSLPLLDMTCILRRWEEPINKVEIVLCPVVIVLGPPNAGTAAVADTAALRSRAVSLSTSTSHSSASSAASRSIQGSIKSRRRSYSKHHQQQQQQLLLYDMDGHHSIDFPRIYSGCCKPPPMHHSSTLDTLATTAASGVDPQQPQVPQHHSTFVIPSTHIKRVTLSTLVADGEGLGGINTNNTPPKLIQLVSTAVHNSGIFFLYFTNINSYHVVRCFLSSCVEPFRFQFFQLSTDTTTSTSASGTIPASPLNMTRFISKGRFTSSISTTPSIKRIHRQGSSFDMDKLQAHKMKDHVKNESLFRRARRKLSYVANSVGDWISSLRMTDCCVALDYQNYCSSDPCGSLQQTYNSTLVTKIDLKADYRSQRNLNGIISMEELSTNVEEGEVDQPESFLPFSTSSSSDFHHENDGGNIGFDNNNVIPQFSYEVVISPSNEEKKKDLSLLVPESKIISEEIGRKRKIISKNQNNYSTDNTSNLNNYDNQSSNSTPPILVANSSSSSITSFRSVDEDNYKTYYEIETKDYVKQQNVHTTQNYYSPTLSAATEFKAVDL